MAIVIVDGKAVHVRIAPGKKRGDPVRLSSNDEQAIRVFRDFLTASFTADPAVAGEYRHETYGEEHVLLGCSSTAEPRPVKPAVEGSSPSVPATISERNRALQRDKHESWCRVPIGGSECSCDRR